MLLEIAGWPSYLGMLMRKPRVVEWMLLPASLEEEGPGDLLPPKSSMFHRAGLELQEG